MGLALLPGISLAPDSEGNEGYSNVGLIESADFVAGSDNLMWHVNDIRERQRDVDRAAEEIKAKVAALVAAAEAEGGGDDVGEDEVMMDAAKPLTFGPTHAREAQRFYRNTEPPPPEEPATGVTIEGAEGGGGEREGRPRKRRSRWESNDDAAQTQTAPGSALALVGDSTVLPDEAAIKAHLAGIVAKNMKKSAVGGGGGEVAGVGAAEGGPTPADSDDPEVVRQYARYTDVAQRIASNDFYDDRWGKRTGSGDSVQCSPVHFFSTVLVLLYR